MNPGDVIHYWTGNRKRRRIGYVREVMDKPPAVKIQKNSLDCWIPMTDIARPKITIPKHTHHFDI